VITARAVFLAAAVSAGDAAGHAGLVASSPADGATLEVSPASVELRFTEPVKPLAVRLLSGSGSALALPVPEAEGEVLQVALPERLSEGLYTLTFRVMSLDAHPIGGAIVFAVGRTAPPPRADASIGERDPLSEWRAAVRAARDLALLIAAGGALFLLCVARFPGERPLLIASASLAAIAALLGVGLQGGAMTGGDLGPWALDLWRAGLLSSFGLSATLAAGGTLVIAAAATLPPRPARGALLGLGACLAIGSLPLTGHAVTAKPGGLAAAALAAHGLTAAFWAGSLVALLAIVIRHPSAEAALVLRRFSRLGIWAVAVLLVAGATFALLQLASVADLVGSLYGWLILGKVALLALLVALALLNRFRFLPMLEQGAPAAAARLRWSIASEVGLIACVVAVTGLLVQTPPPHTAAAARSGFAQKVSHAGHFAEVAVNPARAGTNTIGVRFIDAQGQPFDPDEVLVDVSNQAAGVEPATRPMRRSGPAAYTRVGSELAFPGIWTIEIHARIDQDIATFKTQVPIR
jgi:copper transport protein